MKGKKRMEKRQPGEDELRVQKFLHTVTDFDNPLSIMHTSAMLMNIAMHMYSMVLNKEDLQELHFNAGGEAIGRAQGQCRHPDSHQAHSEPS